MSENGQESNFLLILKTAEHCRKPYGKRDRGFLILARFLLDAQKKRIIE
jgi:hypothetical protein